MMLSDIPEIKECMVYGKEIEGEKELTITVKVIPDIIEIKSKYIKKYKQK